MRGVSWADDHRAPGVEHLVVELEGVNGGRHLGGRAREVRTAVVQLQPLLNCAINQPNSTLNCRCVFGKMEQMRCSGVCSLLHTSVVQSPNHLPVRPSPCLNACVLHALYHTCRSELDCSSDMRMRCTVKLKSSYTELFAHRPTPAMLSVTSSFTPSV